MITTEEVIERACALVEQNHHIPQFVRGDIAAKIRDLATYPSVTPPAVEEAEVEPQPEQ